MYFHFSLCISVNLIVDFLYAFYFTFNTTLFEYFTLAGIIDGFSQINTSAGRRPCSLERLSSSLDKKHLVIDNYARWKIIDPLKLYQRVRDEAGAQERLDDIVFSELREEVARHTLTEIVSINRQKIMEKVHKQCDNKAREYGIEVLDVRIKRADLPAEVAHSVYARMKAERQRIAKKYRSEGEEEAVKIRATTDKEKTILLAESYRQAEKLKGEGDAEAIKIYAEAFEKDPEFYSFVRTLEAYEESLGRDTTVILSSDSEFFRYLSLPTE